MLNITTKEIKSIEVNWDGEKRTLQWNAKDVGLLPSVLNVIDCITGYYTDLAQAKEAKDLDWIRKVLDRGVDKCIECTETLQKVFNVDFGGVLSADVCLALATAINAETSADAVRQAKERRR